MHLGFLAAAVLGVAELCMVVGTANSGTTSIVYGHFFQVAFDRTYFLRRF